ncbi:hypothetical protein [Maribellus mangrovi]|uniref:hypothetical protein n=1 Tax=Maribellus mangrovi TaxID=3133146 RepID=UPI0030EE5B13
MTRAEINKALDALLLETDGEVCIETLDEFFECWLTHERTDSDDFKMRAKRWQAYTSLRKLLHSINPEGDH